MIHWYMVNKGGMATLCTDKEDAEREAADAQRVWPHMGPHRAVQLVEASEAFAPADMATAAAQGFRDGRASRSLPAAGQEPVARTAAERDELFQAAIDFIRTLTGMEPPPIEVAPPEVFAPFREFVDKVQAITARAAPQPAVAAGWVSVKDRLPEAYVEVLLVLDGKHVTTGEYIEAYLAEARRLHGDWMPLPPAPSTEGESNG